MLLSVVNERLNVLIVSGKPLSAPTTMPKFKSIGCKSFQQNHNQMAERKKRSYRKKKTESDDESESAVDQSLKSESETSTPRAEEDVR